MRTHVSAVALAAALLSTNPAMAQLSLGGGGGGLDVGLSLGGENGVNVDVGVGLGGESGLGVDVGAGVGGSDGIGVDAGVGLGGEDGLDVDVDANVGGDDGVGVGVDVNGGAITGSDSGNLVDVNVNAGGTTPPSGGTTGPNGGQLIDIGATPDNDVVPDLRISALNEAVRLDALVDLIGNPGLADIDIDAQIDDRRVSIVPVSSILDAASVDGLTDILEQNGEGRGQLLDALTDSTVLSSILGNEGIDLEDVLAVRINDDGNTEVVVLDGAVMIGAVGEETDPVGSVLDGLSTEELAELDVELLSDEDLARVDLTLLPNEDQRLDAVLRLLSQDAAPAGDGQGPIRLVDLNAILGAEALGQVGDVLGGGNGTPELAAEIVAQLDALGIDPAAVVGIGAGQEGGDIVFVDTSLSLAGLGETPAGAGLGEVLDPLLGLSTEELADLDVDLLTDEELALVDLSLLPNEEQRLDAVIRLLGNDEPSATPSTQPTEVRLIDLDALLGDESLADVSAVINRDDQDGTNVVLDADLLDVLEDAGVAPEAVGAVRLGRDGALQVFLDGDVGTDLAAIDTTITIGGNTAAEPGTGGSGTGAGTGGGSTGTDTGSGTGNTGGNGTGGTGTDGGNTGGSSGNGGDGGGASDGPSAGGSGTGNGNGQGSGNGSTQTGGGSPGVGMGTNAGTATTTQVASIGATGNVVAGTQLGLIADLDCSVGIAALAEGSVVSPEVIVEARRLELVRVVGCAQPLSAPEVAQLREAITENAPLADTLDNAGVAIDDVIGATVSGDIITVYLDRPIA